MTSFIRQLGSEKLQKEKNNEIDEKYNACFLSEFHQEYLPSRQPNSMSSHPIKCENCGKIFPLNPKQFTQTGMHWCNDCLTDLFSRRV